MSAVEMRSVYVKELENLMTTNDKVVVLDADLAKANGTWGLREKFPGRAIDCGIAEANMASVAAGLSSYGYIPFITTFSPFASRRMSDQASLSIAYAKQNVKIIGTDPGIAAELNGGTHMGLEDVAIMRAIPTMVVFEPCDAVQVAQAIPAMAKHYGPVYMRTFRKNAETLHSDDYKFDLFKADVLKEGKDVTLFASGIMVVEALAAAEVLAEQGVSAEVIDVHTVKPLDVKTVIESVKKTGCAVTVENHNIIGGWYSAICEAVCAEYPVPVEPIGIRDRFGEVGKLPYLKEVFGMTKQDIVNAAIKVIAKKNKN